jgi:hypothetical protein
MSERYETLDQLLGKEVVAYAYLNDELALKLEDGTIVEWWGYHSFPSDPQSDGTKPMVEERLEGRWIEAEE